jgi:hypothetical protein
MPDPYKAVWSQAFNTYNYAPGTKARIYFNLSANDSAFNLGDGLDNFAALPGEKKLGICPNDNHTATSFGQDHWLPLFTWVPYCIGLQADYPEITAVQARGSRCVMTVKDSATVARASLYWSPGDKVAWPARYWQEIPATLVDGAWQAEIPPRHSKLAKGIFMKVVDDKGRAVSSVPGVIRGVDPRETACPLWDGDQLWDVRHGAAAWRPIGGIAVRRGAMKSHVVFSPPHTLTIGPEKGGTQFTLVTNSLILAAGHARNRQGLELAIDGNGRPGKLLVSLVQDTGSTKTEKEFSRSLEYGPAKGRYQIPWSQFTRAKNPGESPLGFDGLRIDGVRDDGATITVEEMSLY